jgi:predicted PurR-regulated permease PerM
MISLDKIFKFLDKIFDFFEKAIKFIFTFIIVICFLIFMYLSGQQIIIGLQRLVI